MSESLTNSFYEHCDYNPFNLDPDTNIPISPEFSLHLLLNDPINPSPDQNDQNNDSLNYQNYNPFKDSEEKLDDINDSFLFQKNDYIYNENNDSKQGKNITKENERKEEDKNSINSNKNESDNNYINVKKRDINNKNSDKGEKNFKKKQRKKADNNIKNNNNNDNNNLIGNKKHREHDKTAKDNIKRKIQVNYIKFLRNLLNQINIELLGNYKNNQNIKFFPLNYDIIKKVSKKYFEPLKEQTLGDIFKNNLSPKFKINQNLNIQVYNEITDKNETIKNILDKTYLEFFDVFYLNKKTLNLSKYGSKNKIIDLSSDIGFFKDLLKRDVSDSERLTEDDKKYQKRIEECIKIYFMQKEKDKPIFFVE
jgi:hypothetical protein